MHKKSQTAYQHFVVFVEHEFQAAIIRKDTKRANSILALKAIMLEFDRARRNHGD